ncbi:MAG: phage terminase large subunit family protein, partial [Proteobacteria bacterium]
MLEPSSGYSEVVFMKAAQVGGSEVGLNLTGWALSQGQGPVMILLPTSTKARKFSKKRLTPLIELSQDLSKKILSTGDKDENNSLMEKIFPNASLTMAGANTSDSLKSDPIRHLIAEEITSYPRDVENEGDPLELAYQRTKTFQDSRKIFYISTPGLRRTCRVNQKWLSSDQRKFYVPCPH